MLLGKFFFKNDRTVDFSKLPYFLHAVGLILQLKRASPTKLLWKPTTKFSNKLLEMSIVMLQVAIITMLEFFKQNSLLSLLVDS